MVEVSTDTRQRILHVTLDLVAESGIGAVSNRRVASAAGVSLGSLTYHFPSKTLLLRESLLQHVAEEVERMGGLADDLRAMNPSSAADVVVAVEQEFQRSINDAGPRAELELHLEAARDPELQDASRRCFAAYEDFVAAALQALEVPEPDRHAGSVVAMITGFAIRGLGSGHGQDVAGIADALLTTIKGAATRTPLARQGR